MLSANHKSHSNLNYRKATAFAIILLLCLSMTQIAFVFAASTANVTVNQTQTIGSNKLSTGFCLSYEWKNWRDNTALRQLTEAGDFSMVRIVSTNIEPCTRWSDSSKTGTFNWANVDSLMQRIFQANAQPIITLGFADSNGIYLPPGMALNPSTGLPYPDSFAAYCQEWVKHFQQTGMPVKYYEVMNEAWYYFYPNWNWNEAKAQNFLTLYNTAYNAMHTQNNQILAGNDASLFTRFLNFWKTSGGKLDFFSCHKYDSWGLSYSDSQGLDSAENKFFGQFDSYNIGISQARQLWGKNLPAIATEANFGATCASGTDPRLQQLVGAVWTALVLKGGIQSGFDYICYYDFSSSKSWELANKATGGFGFGMINYDNNQPWYPYYVQYLIGHNLSVGDPLVETSSSSNDIRVLSWNHEETLNTLIVCRTNTQRTVRVQGLNGQISLFKIENTIPYTTPSIQSSQIDASDVIAINGYTVILLQTNL
jgi:hypothetical protein